MTDKLSILFLFADQMHEFAMRCMGTSDIYTPNLGCIAEEGILFKNFYFNAPVYTPFQATLYWSVRLTNRHAEE